MKNTVLLFVLLIGGFALAKPPINNDITKNLNTIELDAIKKENNIIKNNNSTNGTTNDNDIFNQQPIVKENKNQKNKPKKEIELKANKTEVIKEKNITTKKMDVNKLEDKKLNSKDLNLKEKENISQFDLQTWIKETNDIKKENELKKISDSLLSISLEKNKNKQKENSLVSKLNENETNKIVDKIKIEKENNTKSITLNKIDSIENYKKINKEKYKKEADSIKNFNKKHIDSLLKIKPDTSSIIVKKTDYIEIYMSGGGLQKGQNAKLYDRTLIFHSGLVQREYETKLQGLQRFEQKIPRDELVKLAQFIVDLGFFKYKNIYTCEKNDGTCKGRLESEPEVYPLNIVVAIGTRRKNVTIDFFAPGIEPNYVNYPSNIEKIVKAIFYATLDK